jgi:thiosulfate/3-mercaptopyruvate sulfurtransferase
MRRHLVICLVAFLAAAPICAAKLGGIAPAATTDLLVSTAWLEQHLHDANLTIVEVGDRETFEKEHIAGARFISTKELAVSRDGVPNELPDVAALEKLFGDAGVPDRGRIVIYSRDVVHAARAFFTLEYAGRRGDCALLDGMLPKWAEEKRPVETGPPIAAATRFTARPDRGIAVGLGGMKILVEAAGMTPSTFAVVDARPAKNFAGTEAGEDISRAGHIPAARSVPYSANLTSDATPVFRSTEELRALYREKGVEDKATIVTYCRTGMQASVDYFALRLLGRTVHLYDGSFFEWSRATDTQVVGQ